MPTKQQWKELQSKYPMKGVKLTYDPVFYRMLDFLAEQYSTNRSRLVRPDPVSGTRFVRHQAKNQSIHA